MLKKPAVAIVKASQTEIDSSMEKLMLLIGGMDRIIAPFDNVLIKPNWAIDREYTTGAVTHPGVLRKCVNMALAAGARKVVLGDSAIIGKDTGRVIEINGISDMASKRVEVKDFRKSELVTVAVPNALRYRRLGIPREVLECDAIINVPVMKTHDCLPVTLGLKNMKGLMSDKIKRRIHRMGVEEAIIDINRIALADLTIIDGVIGMEGSGPLYGTPVGMNVLIGSFDPLAAEVVAINAMGFDHERMSYIQKAYEAGFGEKSLDRIEIVGESLESIRRSFKTNYFRKKEILDKGIIIDDVHACSGCRNSINTFLNEDVLKDDKKNNVYICSGSYGEEPGTEGYRKLGVGNCVMGYKDRFDCFIPGCPPTKRSIGSGYKKITE